MKKIIVFIILVVSTSFISEALSQNRVDKKIRISEDSLLNIPVSPIILPDTMGMSKYAERKVADRRKLEHRAKSLKSSPINIANDYVNVEPIYNYGSEYIKEDQTVNKNLKYSSSDIVGEIPMSISSSENGAVNASIDIEIPSGIAGVEPSLSLSYSSIGGNGIAGYGWNLTGLSTISHRNLTHYVDGKVAPAKNDIHSLVLDGRRLILTKTISSNSYEFRIESSEGSITAIGNINEIKVKYSNGSTGTFRDVSGTKILNITRLEDRFGNYMDYSYSILNGYPYITSIKYGGNLKQSKPHSVTISFTYENRPDELLYYNIGSQVNLYRRLKTISTTDKTYTLVYSNKHFSMLSKIDCIAKNGSLTGQLSPLEFTYGLEGQNFSLQKKEGTMRSYYTGANRNDLVAVTGKFDSYGEADGMVLHKKRDYYVFGQYKGDGYPTLHSGYNEGDEILVAPKYSDATDYFGSHKVLAEKGYRGVLVMDADIDPDTQEAVFVNTTGSYYGYQNIKFRIFQYCGMGMYGACKSESFTIPSYCRFNNFYSPSLLDFHTGDFLGLGKEVVCAVEKKAGDFSLNPTIYLFDITEKRQSSTRLGFNVKSEDQIVTLDYDNDGKTDIFHFHDTGFDVYTLERTNTSNLAFSVKKVASCSSVTRYNFDEESRERTGNIFSSRWYATRKVLFGDINGDGKMDVIKTSQYGTRKGEQKCFHDDYTWTQCLSNGTGFTVSTYTMPKNLWIDTYKDVLVHDFNGDGFSDIVSTRNGNLQVFLSDGKRISSTKTMTYSLGGLNTDGKLFTMGIESSNHQRAIGYVRDNKIARMLIPNNELTNTFLTKAKYSLGKETEIKYNRIDGGEYNYSPIYSSGYGAKFPYYNFKGYYWAVENIKTKIKDTESSGYKNIQDLSYYYNNAIIHKQGKGFCGFEQVSVYDNISWQNTINKYDPLNWGVLLSSENNVSKMTNKYKISETSNKEPIIRLQEQTVENKLTGVINVKTDTHDKFGNVLTSTLKTGNDITESHNTTYINVVTGNYNLVGLPSTAKVTKNRLSGGKTIHSISQETTNTYNSLHQVTAVVSKVNGGILSSTKYQYDFWSNIINSSKAPYGIEANRTSESYTYTPDGRFIKTYTNEIGKTVTNNYTSNGLLSETIDHKGNKTTYQYDALGRVIKSINPTGEVITINRRWDSSFGATYCIETLSSKVPAQKIYFNAINQTIANSQMNFNGNYLTTKKVYNTRGLLEKESHPFSGATPKNWNTYTYDSYGRMTAANSASGNKKTISYNKLQTTTVVDKVSTTTTCDAAGNIIKVNDNSGDIIYTLDADGQPSSIKALGIETKFTYDTYRRKKSINDPSSGVTSIVYDDAKGMETQTDALNNKTISTFDKYGRVIKSETTGLFTTTYTYDPDFGLLKSETSTNGTSKTYTYDNVGRIKTEKEAIVDGKTLTKTINYDASGRLGSTTYASQTGNIFTESYFYKNGHMEIVKNGNTVLWQLNSVNDMNVPTKVTTGNLEKTFAFNSYGVLTGQVVKNKSNNAVVQNMTYVFNPETNNLTSRKDNKYNKQENFSYDVLNRLTAANVNGTNITYTYDNKGNMTNNSAVGQFTYGASGSKPYALTGATFTGYKVPQQTQSIEYNKLRLPSKISENSYVCAISYKSDGTRMKLDQKKGTANDLIRYYVGGIYEYDQSSTGTKEKLYVGGDAYSAYAVYVKEGSGAWTLYNLCRDHLGSITQVVHSNGTVKEELSYDAWGRLRDAKTLAIYEPSEEPILFLGRGYTGHEHMTRFGLINMNARLYDPVLSRFVSADPHVQNPLLSQNHNRYLYCLNNPLRYTDRNGEWFGIDDLIVAGASFVIGYVSHGISTGYWGKDAFISGGISAATGWLAFNTMGGSAAMGRWEFIGSSAINATIAMVMPPMQMPITDNFALSMSPSFGIGSTGLSGGMRLSGTYYNDDFSITLGGGINNGYARAFGGGAIKFDEGKYISYYANFYQGGQTYEYKDADGKLQSAVATDQWTGTIGFGSKNFDFRWENDAFIGNGDRFRSNAVELAFGNFVIGTRTFTNQPQNADKTYQSDPNMVEPTFGMLDKVLGFFGNVREHGNNYKNGFVSESPYYIGIKRGSQIYKVGFDNPTTHKWSQNVAHRIPLINSPYFQPPTHGRGYFASISHYDPYSMW